MNTNSTISPFPMLDAIILGAGLTGLSLGHSLLKHSNINFIVLEKSDRAGGQIQTYSEQGFTFESGPTSGIISNPEVAELFEDFPHLRQLATPLAKRRMILKNKAFHPLPSGLPSAISTSLFSWTDKLRILGEPFRSRGTNPNESIASLVRRRLGESYYTYAVDPFVGGIYAGDPEKLVTRHALPKLYALEAKHGSFIRGAIALMRQRKTERERKATKAIFSAPQGLSQLTSALADELVQANRLQLNSQNLKARYDKDKSCWIVTYSLNGIQQVLYSKHLIPTIGSTELRDALETNLNLEAITQMRYAPVVQIAVGYKTIARGTFESFGGLIPSCEDKDVLGILNPSACFSGRCPEGGLLLSIFLGGMRSPMLVDYSDEDLKALTLQRIAQFVGIEQQPDLVRIFRHKRAIPQYEHSTDQRIALIKQLENTYPGLYIGGNMHEGIGMSDRIKQGTLLAHKLIEQYNQA